MMLYDGYIVDLIKTIDHIYNTQINLKDVCMYFYVIFNDMMCGYTSLLLSQK